MSALLLALIISTLGFRLNMFILKLINNILFIYSILLINTLIIIYSLTTLHIAPQLPLCSSLVWLIHLHSDHPSLSYILIRYSLSISIKSIPSTVFHPNPTKDSHISNHNSHPHQGNTPHHHHHSSISAYLCPKELSFPLCHHLQNPLLLHHFLPPLLIPMFLLSTPL